jgi:hypothetical protein
MASLGLCAAVLAGVAVAGTAAAGVAAVWGRCALARRGVAPDWL